MSCDCRCPPRSGFGVELMTLVTSFKEGDLVGLEGFKVFTEVFETLETICGLVGSLTCAWGCDWGCALGCGLDGGLRCASG